jgi:hypothetical protein
MATTIQVQSVIYHNDKESLVRAYQSLANAIRVSRERGQEIEVVVHYGDASKAPIYSEDELTAANEAETDDEGKYVIRVSQSYNTSKIEEYRTFLQTGECSIVLVSQYLYQNLLEQNRLRPVTEVFGEKLPAGVLADGCGVRLGDTYLYQHFDAMKVLPEDTVICLLRPYVWGASSDAEKYAEIEEYYKKLVTFGN